MGELSAARVDLAASIFAAEAKKHDPNTALPRLIQSVFEGLQRVMVRLVGTAGYRALLLRAIYLAKGEHEWLGALVVSPLPSADIDLARLDDAQPTMPGAVALLATFLDLFCTFIGEELTLLQVRRVWTDVPPFASTAPAPKETP